MDTRDTTDGEDRQEMSRLAAGDETALDRLMERHAGRLYHYLLRLLHSQDTAEELAQETFVRVFTHARAYDARHPFSHWLYTIATNLVRDQARRRSRHPHVSLEAEMAEGSSDLRQHISTGNSPADQVLNRERAEAVQRAVMALPEELRVPLVLSEYEGRSHAQIAAMTRGTPKAVEMRIYRARQSLRRALAHLLDS